MDASKERASRRA
jgi:hypothetical protein